jgi:CBS domain-containing protein
LLLVAAKLMICPSCHYDNIEGTEECVNCGAALSGLDVSGRPRGGKAPDFIHQPLSSLPIRQAPNVGPSDPVALAIRQMRNADANCVLVMDGVQMAGIITGWDVVQKIAGHDFAAVTCGEVMTRNPLYLHAEDTVAVAINMMASGGFRHVPIVNEGGPTGVIVASDVFRHISPQLV